MKSLFQRNKELEQTAGQGSAGNDCCKSVQHDADLRQKELKRRIRDLEA